MHTLSLTVQTRTPDEWKKTWTTLNEIAACDFGKLEMVSVSSYDLSNPDIQDMEPGEQLYFDEQTMVKVRMAIVRELENFGLVSLTAGRFATNIIDRMQNHGILFREKA